MGIMQFCYAVEFRIRVNECLIALSSQPSVAFTDADLNFEFIDSIHVDTAGRSYLS